jgi:hypothetical protein
LPGNPPHRNDEKGRLKGGEASLLWVLHFKPLMILDKGMGTSEMTAKRGRKAVKVG